MTAAELSKLHPPFALEPTEECLSRDELLTKLSVLRIDENPGPPASDGQWRRRQVRQLPWLKSAGSGNDSGLPCVANECAENLFRRARLRPELQHVTMGVPSEAAYEPTDGLIVFTKN